LNNSHFDDQTIFAFTDRTILKIAKEKKEGTFQL